MPGDSFPLEPVSKSRAKIIADLDRGSTRREHGLFRIEGWRALASAVATHARLEDVVVRDDALTPERIALLGLANVRAVSSIRSKGMAQLTSVVQDQGVVATARMRLASVADAARGRRVLALDGVQDPGNVGTLIRTAAWFGIDAVIADGATADFFNPKVVRATAGGIWDVGLVRSDDLSFALSALKSLGFVCYGADLGHAESLNWHEAAKSILVLGSEGHGLSDGVRPLLDGFVHVQGSRRESRGVESLNVAAAGSILLARWVE